MDRSRFAGWLAEAKRRVCGVHSRGFSAKQRFHLAALLIALAALPLHAQSSTNEDDIQFDPAITQEEFGKFSRVVAQGIYASPVEPARAGGLLRFDVGVAVTAVPVDTNSTYWRRAVRDDFTVSNYIAVPKLIVSKGFSVVNLSASYAKVNDSDIRMWGGAVDVPIIRGGIATPSLAVRGAYSTIDGVDVYKLKTYGAEVFLSKGFGPLTPYGAVGRMRSDAEGRINFATGSSTLTDKSDVNRYTLGLRISLLLPKITIEATQAEERSYAAKVSFGF
ncbi:MAG TPA: hypothetical protein VFN10_10340 [Thermoanaerobaculia bacterium]|nr:hypothetical protein [Thermoanaerobaculia bacterium]